MDEAPLVEAHLRTRHPDHYLLLNESDGTRWRLGPDGRWTRPAPGAEATPEEKIAAALELLPNECYVTQTDFRCTEMIGGTFPNGTRFVEEMCCLPCRIRAALA